MQKAVTQRSRQRIQKALVDVRVSSQRGSRDLIAQINEVGVLFLTPGLERVSFLERLNLCKRASNAKKNRYQREDDSLHQRVPPLSENEHFIVVAGIGETGDGHRPAVEREHGIGKL